MLIAMIADLHGNRPALDMLKKDLELTRPDEIWCLGDLIGKGPASVYTCDWVRDNCTVIVGGNWDYGIGEKHYPRDDFYWKSLGEERLSYLRGLPQEKTVEFSGRSIRLFHGRPIMFPLIGVKHPEEDMQPYFVKPDGSRWDVLFYADTHRQAMRTYNPGILVNIGAVGNALGEPHGCYALMDAVPGKEKASFEVRMRQFEYDNEAAAREALDCDMPNADLFAIEVRTGKYSRGALAASCKGEA